MTRGVVFFDVDGTLVPGISSGQHLADRLGHADLCREAEAGYDDGTLTNQEASVIDARGWATWTPSDVRGFLASLPLVDGIPETLAWCRAHDLLPVVTTLAWDPVGAYLCDRFGFARSCGPVLEIINGAYTGEVAAHLDEYGKRDFALSVATELNIEPSHCAAIGDSRSDLPLFGAAGLAIAFNGDPAARAAAHTGVTGTDLRAVIPLLDTWQDRFR
ncbi:phosphoserine phosphatase [Actinoplanes lutulentus]|uniref:phosphoserine phosphatase n=1 Tax=Actinoplanes lutulentus TaxID=1287878 RepID=A0A327ZQX8_9ACTN|nr:haloacid dehalogenase-like hydrolase [Actinoplanes lutulentus]MBB2941089.1 phosphoserine phosphatase [Actinoplanes lutulentus]RAK43398.1 phosphoserine phosphatase [Actinoplanes lutulentus]